MYQFIHIETFARSASTKVKPSKPREGAKAKPVAIPVEGKVIPKGMDAFTQADGSKGNTRKSTVHEVLAEALRDEGHIVHVENPELPTFLIGSDITLRELESEIEKNWAREKERTGKAPRKDMHVLLAGVASYPRELETANPAEYEKWEKSTVKWLKEKYGDNLRVVLRHQDEAHPHIHFFVCDRTRVNAKELHDGYRASAGLPLSKESKVVFNDAMREMQSDYYAKVGHAAGLLRDGPRRKRMAHPEYKRLEREARERVALDSAAENARASLLDDVSIEAKTATDLRRKLEREAGVLAVEQVELTQLYESSKRERAGLDAEWQRAKAKLSELDTREKTISKSEADIAGRQMVLRVKELHVEQLKKSATGWEDSTRRILERTEERQREIEKLYQVFRDARPSLFNAQDVAQLAQRPELEGMLGFIANNEDARTLLSMMKADSQIYDYVRSAMMALQGLENGAQVDDWGNSLDWSAVAAASEATNNYKQPSASASFLESLKEQEQKPASSGMDFGL